MVQGCAVFSRLPCTVIRSALVLAAPATSGARVSSAGLVGHSAPRRWFLHAAAGCLLLFALAGLRFLVANPRRGGAGGGRMGDTKASLARDRVPVIHDATAWPTR